MLKPIENIVKFTITLLILAISGYVGWLISWELNLSFGKTILAVLGAAILVSAIILWIINKFKELVREFIQVYLSVSPKKKMRDNCPPIQMVDQSQDSDQNGQYTYTVTTR